MNRQKLFLVISREFFIRVRKRSFILMTILTPILLAALMVVPALIMNLSSAEKGKKIVVVDRSGFAGAYFKDSNEISYTLDSTATVELFRTKFVAEGFTLLVDISAPDSMDNVSIVTYSEKQINMDTKETVRKVVKEAVEKRKLERYNISGLEHIISDINTDVPINTIIVGKDGDEKMGMVELNMMVSYATSFLIYMFIFMFGSMVMRGVIEEKTSRIVEVIISSVKPFELMLGKILGVGLVALLQFLIWIVLTIGLTLGFQYFIGMDAAAMTAATPGMPDTALVTAAAKPSILNNILSALGGLNIWFIVLSFIAYFLFGYLLYAAMFAAVGSAVNNEDDTQQLILPVTIPLIIGIFIMMNTFRYPDSALSFWGSIIPFTSPMVMMARVPFGVPLWEMALSLGLLIATFLFITYLSAKVYRVGILMYGKKPSLKDLYKWLKY